MFLLAKVNLIKMYARSFVLGPRFDPGKDGVPLFLKFANASEGEAKKFSLRFWKIWKHSYFLTL